MANTVLSDFLAGGGGNLEFAYTIGGLPFGMTTSQTLVDLLASDTTIRRVLFGDEVTVDSQADNVPLFPIMRDCSGLKVSTDSSKGLDISGFTVNLDNISQAVDLSTALSDLNWPDLSLWGFPTIHSIIDPRRTADVYYGKLSRTLLRQGTTLYFTDDYGLKDYIDAADDIVLYVNQEPVHITAATTCSLVDATLNEYSVSIATRDLFRFPDCTHRIEDYSVSTSYVSSFPLGSASGRKGYVWCFILNDQRTEILDYFLYQHGPIESNINIDQHTISLSHKSPLDPFKTPLKFGVFRGQLEKYILCRGNENSDLSTHIKGDKFGAGDPTAASPHLLLYEWDDTYDDASSGGQPILNSWKITPVWLCEKNTVVVYDTLNDLIVAINNELKRLSPMAQTSDYNAQTTGDDTGSDLTNNPRVQTRHHWSISARGLSVIPAGLQSVGSFTSTWSPGQWMEAHFNGVDYTRWQEYDPDQSPVLFSGQLSVPLNLGIAAKNTSVDTIYDSIRKGKSPWCNLGRMVSRVPNTSMYDEPPYRWVPNIGFALQPHTANLDYTSTESGEGLTNILGEQGDWRLAATPYLVSWYDNDDTLSCAGAEDYSETESDLFPIPVDPTTGDQLLHICNDIDPSLIQENQYFTLGFDRRVFSDRGKTGQRDGEETPLCARGFITALTESDSTNPIVHKEYAIEISGNSYGWGAGVAGLTTVDGQFGPWEIFSQLIWCPTIHSIDPWQLRQGYSNEPQDHFCDIIEAILGGSTDFTVSASYRLDNIPESNTRDGFVALIDFDAIRASVRKITSKQLYKMPSISYDNELMQLGNVWEMLQKEVLIHGHQMTYEYDSSTTPKMFRVRTRPIDKPNYAVAQWNGRVIGNAMLLPRVGSVKHWDSWQYSNIETKFGFDGKDYSHTFNFINERALANIGGQDRRLEVAAKLTHIDSGVDVGKARDDYEDLYNLIGGKMLYNFSFPAPTYEVETTLAAFGALAVGQSMIVTDDSILDPFSGRFGDSLSEAVGFCKSISADLMTGRCSVTCELHYEFSYGASPAMKVSTGYASIDYDEYLTSPYYWTIDPDEHEYTRDYLGVDLAWFDCYTFNPWSREYILNTSCGCSDYAVYCLEGRTEATAAQISGTVSGVTKDVNGVPDTATLNIDTRDTFEHAWHGELVGTLADTVNLEGTVASSGQCMAADAAHLGIGTLAGFYAVTAAGSATRVNTYEVDVVFADPSVDNSIWFVKQSDNNVYEYNYDAATVGDRGIPSATGSITCGSKGADEIVGYDNTGSSTVYAWSSGTTWASWGAPASVVGCEAICSSGSGTCYASFRTSASAYAIYYYNGSSWAAVASSPTAGRCNQIKKVGTDYYFFTVDSPNELAIVYKYNGSSWSTLYDANDEFPSGWWNTPPADEHVSGGFLPSGTPYVCTAVHDGFSHYTSSKFFHVDALSLTVDTGVYACADFNDKIYMVDAGGNLFRVDTVRNGVPYYVYFVESSNANLQSCQEKFTWLANKEGKWLDNSAAYNIGDRID